MGYRMSSINMETVIIQTPNFLVKITICSTFSNSNIWSSDTSLSYCTGSTHAHKQDTSNNTDYECNGCRNHIRMLLHWFTYLHKMK